MTDRPDGVDEGLAGALAEARALGFLGPGPIEDHVRHAEAYEALLPHDVVEGRAQGLDLGSGGGIPGLVLATRVPASRWVLLDASRRRTSFLAGAVARLGLAGRVQVVRGRAEDVAHDAAHRGVYGAVVVRSFGPPPAVAEAAAPLLTAAGALVVAEPPEADDRWSRAGLSVVGLELVERESSPVGLVLLRRTSDCPSVYPRPWRRQQRDPLF